MREAVRKPSTSLAAKRSFSSLDAGQKHVADKNRRGKQQSRQGTNMPVHVCRPFGLVSHPNAATPGTASGRLGCPPTTHAPAKSAVPACAPLEGLLLIERGCQEVWHPAKQLGMEAGRLAASASASRNALPVGRRAGRRYQAAKADRAPQRRSCRCVGRFRRFGGRMEAQPAWRPRSGAGRTGLARTGDCRLADRQLKARWRSCGQRRCYCRSATRGQI